MNTDFVCGIKEINRFLFDADSRGSVVNPSVSHVVRHFGDWNFNPRSRGIFTGRFRWKVRGRNGR